ncbi:MAG: MBL fold metallo-hydrolase [Solirubrobacterales bacterium]|nr:MBL fold metallo-hydrolase [Solirubrobacterales bacterium]
MSCPVMPRRRELGRGERVLPGLWRLRLPLPFPGVPHCNAWAIARGDGIVLVDTGMHEPGSFLELERALAQVGLGVDDVRLVVCTHAHVDHCGQVATICDRTGSEMWMHPNHAHGFAGAADPEVALARRLEIGRQSGVSESALARYAEQAKGGPSGIARVIEPDRELVAGVCIETDLGTWRAFETPGHAPSHVCLFQAERRLLISGDHVMGRISLYFDYGWTPDPIGEFLSSLDVVDGLDARLALSGHGRPFLDVHGHIEGNRRLVGERLDATLAAVAGGPRTALEITPRLHGEPVTQTNAGWWLPETLCYLRHLELSGQVTSDYDGGVERWDAALSDPRTKP